MPNSKLAFLRYMLIDRMLRNKYKKYPTIQEILEACEEEFGVTSLSTVEKDLKAMRDEFEAPISYSKKEQGYYYTDATYKFLHYNLSEEHLQALRFVETFLEGFKELPIFNEFSDAVDKVLDGLELTRRYNNPTQEANIYKFIQIDKRPYFRGSNLFSRLIEHAHEKQPVRITYQKFLSEQPREYVVHPYLLKEFKNLWYLVGYVENYQKVRTFGIDRIIDAEQVEAPFVAAESIGFNAEEFYQYCYGITALDEKPETVILSFSPANGNYIKAQPIHPSQKILADNELECRISLELVNNFELRSLILGFGAGVKVLAPEALQEMVRGEMFLAFNKYEQEEGKE